jgi:hypothetical protein
MVALVFGGQQGPLERQGVHRGTVAQHPPTSGHVLMGKGFSHLAGQAAVLLGHVGVTHDGRGQAHHLGRPRQVGRGHHVGVGLGLERGIRRRGRVQPVAELEAPGPEAIGAGEARDVVDPGAHARQLPRQQADVTSALVENPGHQRGGVAPGRGRRLRRSNDVGDDKGYRSVRLLLGREVGQPGAQEAGTVEQEAGGGREDLDVTGPAQPLVALGTVGGQVDEVAPHPPDDVVVEPVELRVR